MSLPPAAAADFTTTWIHTRSVAPPERRGSWKTERSATMKPRRVCRSGGGMVTGPAAAVLVRGLENLTHTLTTCCHTWATSRQISASWCRTTSDLTVPSPRATGSSVGRAGPTGLLLPHLRRLRCCRHRRGSVLTASRARGPTSGSGATEPWAGSGTGPCRTVDAGPGTEAAEFPSGVTGPVKVTVPWKSLPRENVSFPGLSNYESGDRDLIRAHLRPASKVIR